MRTFEQKWTAWIDDQLTGDELAKFEASLPNKAAAEAEKRAAKKLSALLQRELSPQTLHNADFFSHQVRERIERDERESSPARRETDGSIWWPVRRLVWAGAVSLAFFIAISFFVTNEKEPAEPSTYLTTITQAKLDPATGPDATITIFEAKEGRVTVLWTEGLKSLPAEYAAK